jgi:hypothetical protein
MQVINVKEEIEGDCPICGGYWNVQTTNQSAGVLKMMWICRKDDTKFLYDRSKSKC